MVSKILVVSLLVLCGKGDLLGIVGGILDGGGSNQPQFCEVASSSPPTPGLGTCASFEDLKNGREFQANEVRPDGLMPPWINYNLAKKGQEFVQNWLLGVIFTHLLGLTSSPYPDAVDLLIFTKASDNTTAVEKRYLATITQALVWYDDFFLGAPDPNTSDKLWSINKVRSLHIAAAAAALEKVDSSNCSCMVPEDAYPDYILTTALDGPFFTDLNNSPIPQELRDAIPPSAWTNVSAVPMNQQVAALTQFAFVGYGVLFPERFGIGATDDEIWAYTHLWAVLGYAMGIDDKYNICLQPNLQTARAYFQRIFEIFVLPSNFHLSRNALVLGEKTALGFSAINPIVTPNLIIYETLKIIYQSDANETAKRLTPEEKLVAAGIEATYLPLFKNNPVFRATENAAVKTALLASGTSSFGLNYTTQYCRARNVYYANFE